MNLKKHEQTMITYLDPLDNNGFHTEQTDEERMGWRRNP
jgi:hypothetical protein